MATQPTFSIVEPPKPPLEAQGSARWELLAEKFRDLRLRSLEIAPEAFASTYEAESQRGLDHTLDRLRNPKARQFIAVEGGGIAEVNNSEHAIIDGICKREWVGMIVLIGPVGDSVTAKADPLKSVGCGETGTAGSLTFEQERRRAPSVEYVLNGVFVGPAVRGRGIGKALLDTALAGVKGQHVDGASAVQVTVLANEENEGARKLYQKDGFAVVGQETYTQEPRELLGEGKAMEKVALKMLLDIK